MKTPIAITGLASISPLGVTNTQEWDAYLTSKTAIAWDDKLQGPVSKLSEEAYTLVNALRQENTHYRKLDNSVLYAIVTARKAVEQSGWKQGDFGINIGSSRGATQLFESHYNAFANLPADRQEHKTTSTHTSPSTTLGNIASWVAQDLKSTGPDISHSITCSTALHAVLNGVAWLQSGMTSKFLVGGSEAALTPFTIAQMRAMKLIPTQAGTSRNKTEASSSMVKASPNNEPNYYCKALDLTKISNGMVLGEGAGIACLEVGKKENALAYITGIGYATEQLTHAVSLSANGSCFQKSMRMAIGDKDPSEIDAIVMHAPGTVKGDQSEIEAIHTIFCNKTPLLTTNKWKIGHTFGASGLLSLKLAVQMLQHQTYIGIPYLEEKTRPQKLHNILVNAVGFGGNAVSVLVSI
ncbi:beta-ketoacyl synthase N-terminal-like domain-containing protein [uncultured Dokdonia sp.]|uniref:beta-ketoacyl synthase N-terminal-like domain-containing protein n=1 Tax=uncultured Dokdonia sp. TaxID=575653 RepID=UPI00261DDE19|nr:beta-ketoacyl synthase N-terminal-like domain-containing protein [uncultured Dokdonia sp.]